MSNAFDKASLVMLPHAYEDGKLYSLKPTDRSGDFTFSRGTDTATRVGEDGYIKKETSNLLLQSNTFSDATWTRGGINLIGGQAGYDGSNDAWSVSKTASSYTQFAQSISASGVWTLSAYAKADSLSDITFRNQNDGTRCDFDLLNGVTGFSGSNVISKNISNIGSGWYRCSATFTGSTTQIALYLGFGNSTAGDVYIQDAQLNQGLVAQDYLETTTSPVYGGLTDNMPRLDYTDATCPSLLLEPSRTNLIEYSEYFGSYYTINSVLNKTDNAANSPEGVQNATLISESTYSSAIPVISTGNRYSLSGYQTATLYVKAENNARYFGISFGSNAQRLRTTFDFENNTFNTILYNGDVANGSLSYEELQNGWYRIIVTANFVTLATGAAVQFAFLEANTYIFYAFQSSDNRQFHIYGVQVEQGPYPTSYIPTYGSTQTRAGDNCFTNNNSLLEQTSATYFLEITPIEIFSNNIIEVRGNGSTSNRVIFQTNAGGAIRVLVRAQGSSILDQNVGSAVSQNTKVKLALKYTPSNISFFVDGVKKIDTDVSVDFSPELNGLDLEGSATANDDALKQHQFLFFPEALSDAECIALTTL